MPIYTVGSGDEPKQTKREIAEEILGPIMWEDDAYGFCKCPGEHLHTSSNAEKDCKVFIDGGAPSIKCFHASCESVITDTNHKLRSSIGKMQVSNGDRMANAIPIYKDKPKSYDDDLKILHQKTAWIQGHVLPDCEELPETQKEHYHKHLSLFDFCDNIWIGEKMESNRINPVSTWMEMQTPKGSLISHCTFVDGANARTKELAKSYPFIVVESDTLTKTEQRATLAWLQQHCGWSLRLVIDTAGKSLHGWFDKPEKMDMAQLKALLPAIHCDVANLGISQPSRIAGAMRRNENAEMGMQHIIWAGPPTNAERSWEEIIAIPCESLTDDNGREFPIDELLAFDAQNDINTMIGERWICRRGSLMIVGEAGIGKSALVVQAAVCWSLGMLFFGARPSRPLRSLIIQRENDEGDMAEEMQGVNIGMGLTREQRKTLGQNLKIIQNDTLTGMAWAKWMQTKVMQHQADLVFVDPLLSFADGDISKQADATRFLRRELQPVLNATGCALVAAHHTGKPKSDKDKVSSFGAGSYAALGSSEFTNYFRAVMLLQRTGDNLFQLSAEKRGKRAGLTKVSGEKTTKIKLRHANEGVCWEQVDETSFESSEGAVITLGNSSKVNGDGYSQKGQEYRDAGVSRMPELRHDPQQPQFSEVIPWLMDTLEIDQTEAAKEWEKIRSIGKNPTAKCKRIVAFSGKGKWKGCEE